MEGIYELAASCLRVRENGVCSTYRMKWLALCCEMSGEIYERDLRHCCEIGQCWVGCIGTEEFALCDEMSPMGGMMNQICGSSQICALNWLITELTILLGSDGLYT